MRRDVLLDAGVADRWREDVARDAVDGDAVAEIIDEERACVACRSDAPHLHVPLRKLRCDAADRHHASLLPFALSDEQSAAAEVDIREVEPHELTDAQRRRVEHFEHRAIAQLRLWIADLEDRFHSRVVLGCEAERPPWRRRTFGEGGACRLLRRLR